ncbi:MAG: sigma factor-like helix-turn-helix DNA-binding protein [Patescibacteria group bacterium]
MSTPISTMDLTQILEELFMVLSEKEKEVVKRRFALTGDARQTLEKIGKHFDVTRERIRQIESIALQKLRRTIANTKLQHINELARQVLDKNGGVKLEENLISEVLNLIRSVSEVDGNIIRLSLAVDENVEQERTNNLRPFWHSIKISTAEVNIIADKAVSVLGKQKDIVDGERLVNMVRAALANSGKNSKAETIAATFELDPRLKKTEEGWGLMSWRHINPRSLRDKALIIMREIQKPIHFVEIANKIAEHGFDKKVVTVQAVHNELIRDNKFVLIGRGLYALREWGYSEGTVADIIEDLLTKKSPLSKEEIIRGVLKQRQVKKGTISLNLQKTPWFERVGRALYKINLSNKKGDEATRKRRGGRKN